MKTSPFLVALTFFLGCLVTLTFLHTFREPVQAQSAGVGSTPNVSALSVTVDGTKQFVVVFKEVDNLMIQPHRIEAAMGKPGPEKVTGMAVYEIQTSPTQTKPSILFRGARYIDFDFQFPEVSLDNNGKFVQGKAMWDTLAELRKVFDMKEKDKEKDAKK